MNESYLFELGRHPQLSIAEIGSVFRRDRSELPRIELGRGLLIAHTSLEDPKKFIAGLGGTIKIAKVVRRGHWATPEELRPVLLEVIQETTTGDRRDFGISYLDGQHQNRVRTLGLQVKKLLTEAGIKSRFVMSERQPLSSVIVEREDLLDESGAELIIGQLDKDMVIARTVVVQPFAALSQRDYGRPARDLVAGMLPPKLGIMLLNYAQVKQDDVVLDPFCGSGTVLQEAQLLGLTKVIGTDSSEEAVHNALRNLRWLKDRELVNIEGKALTIRNATFRELPNIFGQEKIDAIVTEPFLGPPMRAGMHPGVVKQALQETAHMYDQFLKTARILLKQGGRLAMVVPMFRISKTTFRDPHFRTEGFHTPDQFPRNWGVDWKQLKYGRPNQHIFRKLTVLVKK